MKAAKKTRRKILSAKALNKDSVNKSASAIGAKKSLKKRMPQLMQDFHLLPDPMNSSQKIPGANIFIPQVGVSNLKLPFKVRISKQKLSEVCCNFSVFVSLQENKRGINMSRILRLLSEQEDNILDIRKLKSVLDNLTKSMQTRDVFIRAEFEFPFSINSLRSEHTAVQYYKAAIEARLDSAAKLMVFNELEFQYSSACPCSAELSEHASRHRQVPAIPHSQRSMAKVRVLLSARSDFLFDKLIEDCRAALVTETQMIVRRQDEQAFAELNGANQKFVEDAVRLLYAQLSSNRQIADFSVNCQHFESLHSHNAVASIVKGVKNGMSL